MNEFNEFLMRKMNEFNEFLMKIDGIYEIFDILFLLLINLFLPSPLLYSDSILFNLLLNIFKSLCKFKPCSVEIFNLFFYFLCYFLKMQF